MTAAYKANRVNGSKRPQRRYATTCKICLMGIYDGDVTVWLTCPMGLSHEGCAR